MSLWCVPNGGSNLLSPWRRESGLHAQIHVRGVTGAAPNVPVLYLPPLIPECGIRHVTFLEGSRLNEDCWPVVSEILWKLNHMGSSQAHIATFTGVPSWNTAPHTTGVSAELFTYLNSRDGRMKHFIHCRHVGID